MPQADALDMGVGLGTDLSQTRGSTDLTLAVSATFFRLVKLSLELRTKQIQTILPIKRVLFFQNRIQTRAMLDSIETAVISQTDPGINGNTVSEFLCNFSAQVSLYFCDIIRQFGLKSCTFESTSELSTYTRGISEPIFCTRVSSLVTSGNL